MTTGKTESESQLATLPQGAHTPGPWEANCRIRGRGGWLEPCQHIQILADQILIADYDTEFVEYPGDRENEANARLIAAAPDMLAALRDLQVIAEQNITDLAAEAQEGAPIARMELARWSAVLAAIAKAEGKSP